MDEAQLLLLTVGQVSWGSAQPGLLLLLPCQAQPTATLLARPNILSLGILRAPQSLAVWTALPGFQDSALGSCASFPSAHFELLGLPKVGRLGEVLSLKDLTQHHDYSKPCDLGHVTISS